MYCTLSRRTFVQMNTMECFNLMEWQTTWVAPPRKESLSRSVIPMRVPRFGASTELWCFYHTELLSSGCRMCPDVGKSNVQSAVCRMIEEENIQSAEIGSVECDTAQSLAQGGIISHLHRLKPIAVCYIPKARLDPHCSYNKRTIWWHNRQQYTSIGIGEKQLVWFVICCRSKEFYCVVANIRNYGKHSLRLAGANICRCFRIGQFIIQQSLSLMILVQQLKWRVLLTVAARNFQICMMNPPPRYVSILLIQRTSSITLSQIWPQIIDMQIQLQ